MTLRLTVLPLFLLAAACETAPIETAGSDPGFISELPEGVVAAAAPFQDLTSVIVRPEDGCYWYRHTGPVETTFLPLRTRDGRPICARAPETVPG